MAVSAKIFIVRHGETDANRNHIIQGQLDTELNENGLRQAKLMAEALKSARFDIVFTSDLRRVAKTAELILAHHPNASVFRQDQLRERNMGSMQGKIWSLGAEQAAKADNSIETGSHFEHRALAWWNKEILGRLESEFSKEKPSSILVVSHGGFITKLVKTLVQRGQIKCGEGVAIRQCYNASIAIIDMEGRRLGKLIQYGNISHLEDKDCLDSNADEISA